MNAVQSDNLLIGSAENPVSAFDFELESDTKNSSQIDVIFGYLNAHYEFKFNFVTRRVLYRCLSAVDQSFRDLTDFDFNSILVAIKREQISCSKDMLKMILESNLVHGYDPYTMYIDSLPEWDGTDYIGLLANTVETTDNLFWEKCFRKWLVAMLGGWYFERVVNHTAIIFSGRQGIGKTRWFRSIIPAELLEFFSSGYIQPKDREVNVKLSECCLILMDELENMSANNIDAIKALITQETTFMRRAYTTRSQPYMHRASFAGTVNEKQFLHDTTGNRRFLCFEAISITVNHGIPLDQLYAQAWSLFNSGFQFWFDNAEVEELNVRNNDFRVITSEEDQLTKYFEKCNAENATHFLSTTDLVQNIRDRGTSESLSVQKMGKMLSANKFLRLKRNGVYVFALKQK